MTYYYVSGVISSFGGMKNHQIMEEKEGKQTCIAVCPYNERDRNGWGLARADALMIAKGLNLLMESKNENPPTPD